MLHQARILRESLQPSHPPRSWAQIKHEKQAYALVGQDDAAQAIYNRMHQRTAQEQSQPCPFTPSLRT